MTDLTLDRPIFDGAAPQAMFLLDNCNDELEQAIGLARIQFMYADKDSDEKKWAEVIRVLRDEVNLC